MPWGQGGGSGGGGWGWGGDGGGVTNIIHAVISGITEVVAGGVLRADKATYDDTTAGWWLGRDPDDAVSKLHFGDAAQYLKWTGAALQVAGSISGFITDLVIATAGAIRSGKTLYDDDTAGWWIGYDDATEPSAPRINIGDASYYVKWTGTALEIVGAIGGAITDLVMATNGAIRSGKTGPTDTTPGWWIGEQFGTPKFNLGDDEDAIAWNGSYLSILGRIGGEISELVVSSLLQGVFRSGKTSFSDDVNAGWWMGFEDGVPKFHFGNSSAYMWFDPTDSPPLQYKWSGAFIDTATIEGSALVNGAVGSTQIASGAVTSSKIGASAVGSTALASGAVTASKIASGAVTALALATGAVGSSALASGAVTSGKIASAAVTYDKISVSTLDVIATDMGDLDVDGTLTIGENGRLESETGRIWVTRDGYYGIVANGSSSGIYLIGDTDEDIAGGLLGTEVDSYVGVSLYARGDGATYPESVLSLFASTYDDSAHGGAALVSLELDTETAEVRISNAHVQLAELASDPAAPSSNQARLYCRDNGSGKTQLCVRFSSGAVQVLATQP